MTDDESPQLEKIANEFYLFIRTTGCLLFSPSKFRKALSSTSDSIQDPTRFFLWAITIGNLLQLVVLYQVAPIVMRMMESETTNETLVYRYYRAIASLAPGEIEASKQVPFLLGAWVSWSAISFIIVDLVGQLFHMKRMLFYYMGLRDLLIGLPVLGFLSFASASPENQKQAYDVLMFVVLVLNCLLIPWLFFLSHSVLETGLPRTSFRVSFGLRLIGSYLITFLLVDGFHMATIFIICHFMVHPYVTMTPTLPIR